MEANIKKMYNIWKPTGWASKSWKQAKTRIVSNTKKLWNKTNWKS